MANVEPGLLNFLIPFAACLTVWFTDTYAHTISSKALDKADAWGQGFEWSTFISLLMFLVTLFVVDMLLFLEQVEALLHAKYLGLLVLLHVLYLHVKLIALQVKLFSLPNVVRSFSNRILVSFGISLVLFCTLLLV